MPKAKTMIKKTVKKEVMPMKGKMMMKGKTSMKKGKC